MQEILTFLIIWLSCIITVFSSPTSNDLEKNYEKYNKLSVPDNNIYPPVKRSQVTFRLWTSLCQNYIKLESGKLKNITGIKVDKPFKLIVHGWMTNVNWNWIKLFRIGYLNNTNTNFIDVDWSGPASVVFYPYSAWATRYVGKYISEIILELNEIFNVPLSSIHLMGHSLGSHVVGFAGKEVQKKRKQKVGRITGLDPAGPLFNRARPKDRLNSNDAVFVDVIHTDRTKYGYYNPMGTIDFYPNGGWFPQPGCLVSRNAGEFISCSHHRAVYFWIESIISNEFISNICKNYDDYRKGKCKNNQIAIMGERVNQSLKGKYYLTTNGYTPFARNGTI